MSLIQIEFNFRSDLALALPVLFRTESWNVIGMRMSRIEKWFYVHWTIKIQFEIIKSSFRFQFRWHVLSLTQIVSSSFYKKSLAPCRYSRDSIHDPVFTFFINPIWIYNEDKYSNRSIFVALAHTSCFSFFSNPIWIYNEDIRIGQNLLRFDVDSKCSPFWFMLLGSRFLTAAR